MPEVAAQLAAARQAEVRQLVAARQAEVRQLAAAAEELAAHQADWVA
jgi:hypothetical protein